MSPLATVLCAAMIACGIVGVLTASRLQHGRLGAIIPDAAMLLAMVDVCLLGSRVLAPVAWAALLLVLALGTVAAARRLPVASRWPVAAHALGLVVTAASVLMLGSAHSAARAGHHGNPWLLVAVVLLATGVHVALAVVQLGRAGGGRVPVLRASAAAAGSAAMGALALVGVA